MTKTSVEEEVPINKSLLTDNVNKVLQVNSSGTGLTVTTLPSSGTKLYQHELYASVEDAPFIIIDDNENPITLDYIAYRLTHALAYWYYGYGTKLIYANAYEYNEY